MLTHLRTPLVAAVILVFAFAGTATAAKLITGKHVKNNSLTGKDLKNGSVQGRRPQRRREEDPHRRQGRDGRQGRHRRRGLSRPQGRQRRATARTAPRATPARPARPRASWAAPTAWTPGPRTASTAG